MAARTALLVLLVAVAMGLGAYLLLTTSPKPPGVEGVIAAGSPIMSLDSGAVRAFAVAKPGEPPQSVLRRPGGEWVLVRLRPGADAVEWPISRESVSAMFRLLADTRAIGEPAGALGPDATLLTLVFDDGDVQTLRFAATTIGGSGDIEVSPRAPADAPPTPQTPIARARVPSSLHKMIASPGPMAWRDAAAFPGLGPDIARIHLRNQDQELSLSRLEGRWRMTAPASSHADDNAVSGLVAALGNVRIADFLDDGSPSDAVTLLDSPVAVIRLESDTRTRGDAPGVPRVTTVAMELLLGAPSDPVRPTRYARQAANGPTVVVSAPGLTRETFDPTRYVGRRAVDVPAADVGGVRVQHAGGPPRTFIREMGEWVEVREDDTKSPLSADERRAIDDALTFLTTEPASGIVFGRAGAGEVGGRITLLSLGGAALAGLEAAPAPGESITLTPAAAPQQALSVLRMFPVARTPPLVRWAAIGPGPVEPLEPQPPPGPPEDINK